MPHRDELLKLYRPPLAWREPACLQMPWRPVRGEGPLQATAAAQPAADGFTSATRQLGVHNFDVEEILGEGNYSQVFTATLRATQETYAFKIVDKSKCQRYKKMDEVLVEKWVLANMRHPSVIKIFHTFQDRAALYLVLEHVPGGELWAAVHKQGLRLSLASFYVAQLLEVLQYLHEGGVVHRDVKPENVLLTKDGHVKLIDYGTAKLMDEAAAGMDHALEAARKERPRAQFKNFVGTPEYMCPEAINNKPTDFRSDLWSLGAFACMVISGHPCFKGGSDYLTFKRVMHRKFILPTWCGMPPVAADLIEQLCVLEPAKRLGGAAELCEPPAGRHEALRAHPFFDGCRGPQLSSAPLPVPTLAELCVPLVCDALQQGGWWASMRGPPPAEWAEGTRMQVAFGLHKRAGLTDALRAELLLGEAPEPIDDQEMLTLGDEEAEAAEEAEEAAEEAAAEEENAEEENAEEAAGVEAELEAVARGPAPPLPPL